MSWQELTPKAQRIAVGLGVYVALALLILMWPAGGMHKRPPARPKPTAMPRVAPGHGRPSGFYNQ